MAAGGPSVWIMRRSSPPLDGYGPSQARRVRLGRDRGHGRRRAHERRDRSGSSVTTKNVAPLPVRRERRRPRRSSAPGRRCSAAASSGGEQVVVAVARAPARPSPVASSDQSAVLARRRPPRWTAETVRRRGRRGSRSPRQRLDLLADAADPRPRGRGREERDVGTDPREPFELAVARLGGVAPARPRRHPAAASELPAAQAGRDGDRLLDRQAGHHVAARRRVRRPDRARRGSRRAAPARPAPRRRQHR